MFPLRYSFGIRFFFFYMHINKKSLLNVIIDILNHCIVYVVLEFFQLQIVHVEKVNTF
jgi:hypothetical protein